MALFEVGKVYRFMTLAPSLLTAEHVNVQLIAMMDYQSALRYESVDVKYRSVYPLLPQGTPDTPRNNIYYLFRSESGEQYIMCHQWIKHDTVEIIEHVTIRAVIENVSLTDVDYIRAALNGLGYRNFSINIQ